MLSLTTATFVVLAAKVYGCIGAAVAAAFLLVGIDRIDPAAHGAYIFRPLLIPGMILLWPLVLYQWASRAYGGKK